MVTIPQFNTLPPTILPTLQNGLTTIIETQTQCFAAYLSFWLLSEQRLATSGYSSLAT